MKDDAPADAKAEARFTLYTVLKETLVLLHPIIPSSPRKCGSPCPATPEKTSALQLFPEARPAVSSPAMRTT